MTSGPAQEHSSSSPEPIFRHADKETTSNLPNGTNRYDSEVISFARSASSTQLAGLSGSTSTAGENLLRRTLSENVLIRHQGHASNLSHGEESDNSHQTPPKLGDGEKRATKLTSRSAARTKIAVSQFTLDPSVATEDDVLELHVPRRPQPPTKDGKGHYVSRSFSRLARRPWASRARSSSPSPSVPNSEHEKKTSSKIQKSSSGSALNATIDADASGRLAKGRRRPLSALMRRVPSDSTIPSVPAIPTSFSTDKLPAGANGAARRANTFPRLTTWELSQSAGIDPPRRKDELSGAFRTLDAEFYKFQSRTSTLKAAVVRSALLPFLRTYANHPSNTALRPDDLHKRVNVLNKWWVGLLTMLSGRNGESVSGSDRPTVLDAVTSIMVRMEWSLPHQASNSRAEPNARPVLKSHSTTSLATESSDFPTESIFHNVRNLYAQNLLSQMAYVVEKMSSRSVPASVVTFCGKATAYAFFYCEGIAEILVRLWATPPDMIRRILTEHRLPRDADLKSWYDSVVPNFPCGLHRLGFKSLKTTMHHLRSQPQVPRTAAHIPWNGPWVRRWAGRETDLFFIFTRSYYNLMTDCLPHDLVPQRRLCAPGYVLLQAQILIILDTIILRGNNQSPLDSSFGPSFQYDDLLGTADATAPILPLPPATINRSMAENRVVILLRDCLSGSSSLSEKPKAMFAETFENLLRAAGRRISVFNSNACFTLCDFMEEALAILYRYSTSAASSYTTPDWPFWLKVCRQMMDSQNTMTEIRVYALLYSIWGIITADASRKQQVCFEWLLDEAYFRTRFNHWCPMVRAYYMRLLCWRVGRLGDRSSDVDIAILKAFSSRLDRLWFTFLHLQEDAIGKGGPRLSTAPCSPAPSRRLLIIRNDSQPTPSGMFLTFDSILSVPSSTRSVAHGRHGSVETLSDAEESSASKKTAGMGKRSWSILKNMMPFNSSITDPPSSSTGQTLVRPKSSSQTTPNMANGPSPSKHSDRVERPAFRAHSFKFSLEWIGDEASPFGKERQLDRPRLPVALPPSDRDESSELEGVDVNLYEAPGAGVCLGKYTGRALAEWEVLMDEFTKFSDRRQTEGVPHTLIETPTLGVDTFRRPG